MGAITGTKALLTELAGDYKLVVITAPISSADDAITISLASHGISAVTAIVGALITGGLDADFCSIQATLTSSTVITIVSLQADGAVADEFTGTTVSISVLGK